MALTTYTNLNVRNDPIIMSVVDTCTGCAPAERAATFTPSGGPVQIPAASDYGTATTAAVRAMTFEPPSYSATIDPGLMVNG